MPNDKLNRKEYIAYLLYQIEQGSTFIVKRWLVLDEDIRAKYMAKVDLSYARWLDEETEAKELREIDGETSQDHV